MGIPKGHHYVRGLMEGAAEHDAPASGNPVLIGGEFDDTSVDTVDEGDVGKLRINAQRSLYVNIRDRSVDRGVTVDSGGRMTVNVFSLPALSSLTTSGTFTLTSGSTQFEMVQGTDWTSYGDLVVSFGGTWTGSVAFEESLDDVTYVPLTGASRSGNVTSITAADIVRFTSLTGRVRFTFTFSSGQVDGYAEFFTFPSVVHVANPPKLASNSGVDIGNVGVSGNISVTNVSGQVKVTAGNANLPVNLVGAGIDTSNSAVAVSVRSGVLGNVAITQISGALTGGGISVSANGGSFPVTAQGGSIAVSQNAPGGWIGAARGDAVYNATVSNPVKFATIETPASAGNHSIVAAVASRRIKVLGYTLVSDASAQVCFRDATAAGSKLTGSMSLASHGGASPAANPWGQFQTNVSHALMLHQSVATTVAGHLTYQEAF